MSEQAGGLDDTQALIPMLDLTNPGRLDYLGMPKMMISRY